MKSFRFESIYLLSRRERRARHVSFHPRKNLLLGPNHAGKSTVLRSMYETLGASPEGRLSQWDEDAISVVAFSVDQDRYFAVHQRGNRALFDSDHQLVIATGSHAEWSKAFAETTGFNLVVTNRQSEAVLADPACFFLLFYINQDGSWQSSWNTFKGMGRYKAPWSAILQYFSGMRPPEFYAARARKDGEERALEEVRKEHQSLERARDRIGRSVPLNGPKVTPEVFELEISSLVSEVTALNEQQEALRDRAVREEELLESLNLQVRLALVTLSTYESDSQYLRSEAGQELVCPTCGAEHSHSFLDFLTYAEDARLLRDLVLQLHDDAEIVKERHRRTRHEISDLANRYHRISDILDIRRGEVQFREVVRSMGAESAVEAFAEEEAVLRKEIQQRLLEIDSLLRRLKELTNPKRSRLILRAFREYYASARKALNLPPIDALKMRLESRPDLSGSGGPRSILAYYAALWRLCSREDGNFSIPVVIDSPNQQGQDKVNLPTVLRFIAQDLPEDIQLIVGLESEADYAFDHTIHLTELYRLLQEGEYESVDAVVEPLEKWMFDALLRRDQTSLFSHE